jgi:hypothetical protein
MIHLRFKIKIIFYRANITPFPAIYKCGDRGGYFYIGNSFCRTALSLKKMPVSLLGRQYRQFDF